MDEFWKNNGDKVLVGVVTAIVILILFEPIKALHGIFHQYFVAH